MGNVLNAQEVMDQVATSILLSCDKEVTSTATYGRRRKDGHLTEIRVNERDGVLHINVVVPGYRREGFNLHLFADEATPGRIQWMLKSVNAPLTFETVAA